MTVFLKVQGARDLAGQLLTSCNSVRDQRPDTTVFFLDDVVFSEIPGSPFAYWSSSSLRSNYVSKPSFEYGRRFARVGLQTSDDFRFVRSWWEPSPACGSAYWHPFVRGGAASRFFGNLKLVVNWKNDGDELKAWASKVNHGKHWSRNIRSPEHYGRPGITWPLRAAQLSPYPMPAGCIFSTRGTVAFDDEPVLDELLGLMASSAFDYLFKLLLGRFGHPEFSIGAVQKVPVPHYIGHGLGKLARSAWSLKRKLDTVEETSHAFLLPAALRDRLDEYDPAKIEAELYGIQTEIDEIAFDLYGFSEADRAAVMQPSSADNADGSDDERETEDEVAEVPADNQFALLSWAVGVVFGRFDWRLATGERSAPPEPCPFDALPSKSSGMLPDGAEPFLQHIGIRVDDHGHPQDLAFLVEEVLTRVNVSPLLDVRRWLQRDFFTFHLQRYSKSRRKAPIYWPLATASGSYTLWLYYPSLSDQTLFSAVNDFVDPKLKNVRSELDVLRSKGPNRSKHEEKQLEALASLEHELGDLRDSLLEVAPNFQPNHDDGVQITAAPLWKLFRLKPWQKVLKDTLAKLEKGDYDWAHLAMNYWPDRVREKCITDQSLAIAHDLEHLYIEQEPKLKAARGRQKAGSAE